MSKKKKKLKKSKDKLWHFFIEKEEYDKERIKNTKEIIRLQRNEKHFYDVAGRNQTSYRKIIEELEMIKDYIDKLTYGIKPICRDMEQKYLKKIDKSKENEKN